MEPAGFACHVHMFHAQPGNIADTTAGPIAERKDRGATRRAVAFDQVAQNIALVRIKHTWRIERLWRNTDTARRITPQGEMYYANRRRWVVCIACLLVF